jgi:hypothetical protein
MTRFFLKILNKKIMEKLNPEFNLVNGKNKNQKSRGVPCFSM